MESKATECRSISEEIKSDRRHQEGGSFWLSCRCKKGVQEAQAQAIEIVAQAQKKAKGLGNWLAGLASGWHEPSAKAKAEATKVKAEAQKAQEEAQKALEDAEKVKAKAKKEADQRVATVANQLTEERTKTKDLEEELRKAQEQANDLARGWHSTKTQPKEQTTTEGASSRSEGVDFLVKFGITRLYTQRRRKWLVNLKLWQ